MKARVTTALLAATALIAVAAVPAAAKPGKGKPTAAQRYEVTMELAGAEGLTTTGCSPLVMTEGSNSLVASDAIDVGLEAGIHWQRAYPWPLADTAFTGCHGSNDMWDGYLRIALDSGSGTISFLWHFDYFIETTQVTRGHKTQTREVVRENFTLSSAPIPWTGLLADPDETVTGTVAGDFAVRWYLFEDGTLTHDYDWFYPDPDNPDLPAVTEAAIRPLEFTLTVAPLP